VVKKPLTGCSCPVGRVCRSLLIRISRSHLRHHGQVTAKLQSASGLPRQLGFQRGPQLSPCPTVPILAQAGPRMIDRTKKLPARFYVSPAGRMPVREWLLELSNEHRRTVGKDIQKVEFAWPIGKPVCAPLREGLWEVRSNFSDGTIGRVIFCVIDGQMVLLHGFIKKTQKTPHRDIELALRRKREVTP
jgi:phage-related protein